jgi:UDP-glucose 4-epimerase
MQTIETKKVLIIGVVGGLAQLLARLILKENPHWTVIGVDPRDVSVVDKIPNLFCKTMKYSRGHFETLFRDHDFDYVFHLARISHTRNAQDTLAKRLELSVMGTSRILDLCVRHNVKKVIVLSTYHVYGAIADNPVFLKEDAPLRASINYAELRDVVEMDQICTNWMWRYQNQLSTVVMRPCNIIGSKISNSMSTYLTSPLTIRPIDYNPMFQFIHEFDMARVLHHSMEHIPTGIYNVANDEYITLSEALNIASPKSIPFIMSAAPLLNKILSLSKLDVPDYFIDYLKYSCLIDNSHLKKYLPKDFFRFTVRDTLKLMKLS